MCRYKILLLILSSVFYISSPGQDVHQNALDSFLTKFSSTIKSHGKQQAYLVTDKSVFRAGETIWFKAFLLNSISHKTYTKSRFLFVDLVNEKDTVLGRVILDAAEKKLDSRIVLPNSIPAGYYWMRAYTRQMAAENGEGMGLQPIYIFSKTDDNSFRIKKTRVNQDSAPVINFYPEGNCIMTGVSSTVALRVSQDNGEPLTADGYLKDSRDTIVARFATNSNGLGKFVFEPSGYRKYRAIINWHGTEISYPLPPFSFYGAQLSVAKQTGGYKLRVLLGDSIYRKDVVTYLVGVAGDSLIFASIGRGLYEIDISEQQLSGGINTFYLFDKDFNLRSERSVYVPGNNIQVKLATDKESYGPRDKVSLNISVTDAHHRPIPSLFAISVIDTLSADPDAQRMLPVTSCFQRSIDNTLLAHSMGLSDENTDLMMLAKNNTYQSLSNPVPEIPGEDADSLLFIKGVVWNQKNEPAENKIVTLLSNSNDLYLDTTDSKGRFRFPLDAYADSIRFIMEVKNLNGRTENSTILHDPIAYPKIHTPVCLKQYLPIDVLIARNYLKKYPGDEMNETTAKSLLPVTVTSRTRAINYDESKRVSKSSVILTSDNITEQSGVKNAVLMVGGLQVIGGYLVMNGPTDIAHGISAGSEPLLIVNGAQTGGGGGTGLGENSMVLGYLESLNPLDIDFIEILKGPEAAIYGVRGGNGAILVNTLSTRRDIKSRGTGIRSFYPKGISQPVVFPNTVYDNKNSKTATIVDNRSTLFWNGSYLTGGTPAPALSFYTSDIPAAFRVTITGITVHGDIIYKTITFQNK